MSTMASSEGSGKSGALSHFEYQECPTKGLQEGDTTIMLRGLVRTINLDGFLKLLRNVTSNYDLVYVPVGNKRSTNLGLAFVNYIDPEGARTAFEQLYQARSPHTFRMVKRAYVQGLGPNLAFVLASGDAPLVHKHGIAVFQGGHRVKDISSLVQRNVTDGMLAEAQVLMTRIQTEQKDQKEHRANSSDREGSASAVSGDVPECQSSTSGSSGRVTWFADRVSATMSDPISHSVLGSGRSSFSHGNGYIGLEEEFLGRQSTREGGVGVSANGTVGAAGAIGQGIPNSQFPGIPGAWYWQHDVPGYRGREEPSPIPLSDQYRFHLAWEASAASAELRPPPQQALPRQENPGLGPYQRLVFDL
mmetsp:Transcript_46151/g.73342  ORF Transcript_46151/g.73342 Transcript_46151/m.73342 type:complete len:361 (-) Transcript_46151:326-1408(-)